MRTTALIKKDLIAPCGMNCAICMGHLLRDKNICLGCRGVNINKPQNCVRCVIVKCKHLNKYGLKYCSPQCGKFPCKRLVDLDKRYRTKYNMSMIENLHNIYTSGIRAFVKNEKTRWTCAKCGGIICVHRGYCVECGSKKFHELK